MLDKQTETRPHKVIATKLFTFILRAVRSRKTMRSDFNFVKTILVVVSPGCMRQGKSGCKWMFGKLLQCSGERRLSEARKVAEMERNW